MPAKHRLSQKALRTADPPIAWLMEQALANPDVISLAAGLVDQRTLPAEDVKAILGELLGDADLGRAALQYGTTDGHAALRQALLDRVCHADGVRPVDLSLGVDDVLITTGCQQLLVLLSEVLLDPGDIVFLGDPSYFVFLSVLDAVGAQPRGVPLDEDGMRVDVLDRKLAAAQAAGELERVKAVYVIPYFQNPSGISLSGPRRQQLYEVVQRYSRDHQILIIEDAAYRELRYEGDDVPSVKSLDTQNQVVACGGTFSKPFSPGLRTGWGFLPPAIRAAVRRQKSSHDFGSNNFDQYVLEAAMAGGRFERHVERLRGSYRRKRDVMLDAVRQQLPPAARCVAPRGGLYVWLTLPDGVATGPDSRLFAAAFERGMLYLPGEFCYCAEPGVAKPRHCLRLSFGLPSEDDIREGIRRLGDALHATL